MSLYNNVPTMSWIHATGISVIWCGELYTVQDFSTNKKYVYWNATIPNQLNASNVMPDRSIQQFLVLVNDNGIATEVPSTTDDFSIAYDGNSTQAIRDRIFGLYEKNEEFGNKFVSIEQNIDGIKQIVGSSENDEGTLVNKVSVIEQRVGSIDLSVQEISKNYNDDKETNQIRENLNGSIIKLNSNLGTFKSELTSYFKNNEISDDEMIKISTQLEVIEVSKVDVDNNVDLVILIAQKNNQGQDVVALESAKKALDNAHTNLKNNITNAALDRIITPTEITVVIDAFAKCSLRINELKNTCDDVIILGLGGVITEELASISLKSDEIKLAVSQIESTFKSDTSVAKIESEKQIEDNTMSLDILKKSVEDSYKDGTISDAEKKIIEEKIPLLLKEKGDVDTLVDTYSKSEYISDSIKTKLTSMHKTYVSKHNALIEKIRNVISDGFVNDAEKSQLDTVFKECLNSINTISIVLKESIDNIGFNKANIELQKAKEEINKQITDVTDSVEDLEGTMNGAFQDGVLTEAEKLAIKQNLLNLSSEKSDIDKQYATIYSNPDLVDPCKSNFKIAYDEYVASYNSLVSVINAILNKTGLVDDTDRNNLNNAFRTHDTKLGLYTVKATESVDAIAKKKAETESEKVDKKYAEILLTPDGIVSKVERTHEQINGSNGIEKRLSTAEEKITPEGITQTVQNSQFIKDLNGKVTTNTSNISKIDQKADSINLEVQKKVNNNSIISSINMSPESIKINASKVNITGFVTFSNLTDGVTTISGSNIKTGIIDSNKVNIKGGTTKKIVIANDNYCVYDGAETDVNRKVFIGFRKHSQTISVPSIILGYNGVKPDTDGSVTPGGTYTTYSHYKNYDNPEGVNLSYSALAFKYNAQPNDICTFNMYQDGKIGVQAGTSIHLRANKSSMGNAQFVIENDKVYSRKNLSTYGTFYAQGTISTGGSVFATGDSSFDRKVTAGSFNTAGTIYASGNISSDSNIYVGSTLKVPNMYTNRFYFESSSHLAFGKNSYNNNMSNGTHWDWQGHNLVNVFAYGTFTGAFNPSYISLPSIEDDIKHLDLNNLDTLGQIKFREITKYNGETQEIIDTTNVTNLSEITSGNDVDLIKIVNLLIKEVQYLKEKNRLGGI